MTENKRFNISSDNNQNIFDAMLKCYYSSIDAQKLCSVLNELHDENEQLKSFQDRVFNWIDMHLQRLPTLRDDEFESDNEFADPSLYSGAIQILETMKRELKGDVE